MSDNQLGRVIVSRRTETPLVRFLGTLTAMLAVLGVAGVLGRYTIDAPDITAMCMKLGVCALAATVVMGILYLSLRPCLTLNENGVAYHSFSKSIVMLAHEIGTYSHVTDQKKGPNRSRNEYARHIIEIQPIRDGLEPIIYKANVQRDDTRLDALREQTSNWIAHQMAKRFHKHGSVQWTVNLSFERHGIGYFGGLFRKKKIILPYDQIDGWEVLHGEGGAGGAGVLEICTKGDPTARIREDVSAVNFYPGLVFLYKLFASETEHRRSA